MSAANNHLVVLAQSPVHLALPGNVDVDEVLADVAVDGVFAPAADVPGLTTVVADARERGVELSVVVLDSNPDRDSDLRDLATTVGKSEGGTVLVLSPNWMGTYSDSISRVELETAQDRSFGESAATTAERFTHEIVEPGPPWAAYTVVIVAVVAAFVGAVFLTKWRKAHDVTQNSDTVEHPTRPDVGSTSS
ncbi:hypothetical protein ABH922_002038 [Rhodococcus sp. 27YEA15]|uniref:Rv1476 family membrane protein n=1 Tax=Rhodococcus sp. 27YEA15 TaxID=3156259 RepID=UPI003C7CBBBB